MKKYLLDENLSPDLAKALHVLCKYEDKEIEVIHITEKFPKGIKDIEWITTLKDERNWVIISQDKFRKEAEKEILKNSKLTCFVLAKGWGSIKFWEKAWKLIKAFPDIVRISEKMEEGTIFELQLNGKFKN